MNIHFLGFGSAFNPSFKNTNAYFTVSDNLYFVDFGETAFEIAKNKLKLEDYNKITVILTHLHADHVGSLPTLISYMYYVLGKKISVIHPNDNIIKFLDLTGIERECYDYFNKPPKELEKDIHITPIPVKHVKNMDSYGYIIEISKKKVYFSGDAVNIPDEVLNQLETNQLDRIYQDTSSEEHENPTHCSFNQLKQLVKEEYRHKVYCVHLDKDFRKEIKEAGFLCIE